MHTDALYASTHVCATNYLNEVHAFFLGKVLKIFAPKNHEIEAFLLVWKLINVMFFLLCFNYSMKIII